MRVAAKRTALGDASNTANASRPSKDDSAIAFKGDGLAAKKIAPLPCDKKTTSLLRPAQRPLSVMKGFINNAGNNLASIPVKQGSAEVQQPTQPTAQLTHSRKVLQKRSTAVLKDTVPISENEQALTEPQGPQPSITGSAPLSNTEEPPPPPPPQHGELDSRLRRSKSRLIHEEQPKEAPLAPSVVHVPLKESATVRSDGLYIDNHGEYQLYQFMDDLDAQDVILSEGEGVTIPQDSVPEVAEVSIKKSNSVVPDLLEAQKMQVPKSQKPQHLPILEPEEYWDDDAEEENYDEEGYVTARSSRSYRSRGDNTTSGATTVLFPKPSQRTQKELAVAKAFMEAAKAAEEVDDETWDTTMVAEYGDEIFQYMMELEVIPNISLLHARTNNILVDKVAPQCSLYGQSGRDPVVDAVSAHGLASSGASSLWPSSRNVVPLLQLYRPFPVMQDRLTWQVAAGWCNCYIRRGQVRRNQLSVGAGDRLHGR